MSTREEGMESRFKPAFDVSQGNHPGRPAYPAAAGAPAPLPPPLSPPQPIATAGIILRVVAIVSTFIAAVVMGAARQTTMIVDSSGGLLTSIVTKSTYSAAYVYFVVANVLVLFYSIISLVLSVVNRAGMSSVLVPFSIADLLVVVLLFSGNGAAAAISVVAEKGQMNLAAWGEICSVFGGFCARVNAAIVLSMIASVAYVLLVVFSIVGLRRPLN